jgi:predicted nucleic acid-binding protein
VAEPARPTAAERCIVDTNIISYLFRRSPDAELYRAYLDGRELGVSFQTLAELRRWAIVHHWGAARWARLERMLEPVTVYLVNEAVIAAWAEVAAQRERRGRPIMDGDAWIAATALVEAIPLVTHNRRDFEAIDGLTIVSRAPV